MEAPWRPHGGPLEAPWRPHGGPMEAPWRPHGGLMWWCAWRPENEIVHMTLVRWHIPTTWGQGARLRHVSLWDSMTRGHGYDVRHELRHRCMHAHKGAAL